MSDRVQASSKQFILELLKKKDLLKIIINALSETIAGYTQTTVTHGVPFLQEGMVQDEIAVGGLIRFEGIDFNLELFLGFSKELFSFLYENMFQMPPDEISSENHDLAGELLNIAFGIIDPKFRELGYRLNFSLPILFSGAELVEVCKKIDAHAIVIPYNANDKSFVLRLYSVGSLPFQWNYPGKNSDKKN